jgi:hypothetical protein
MLYHCILKNGIVYVPTVARVEAGGYMDIEPVAVVPISNTEGLRRVFRNTISGGNTVIPTPTRANHPPPVLLKYAGVKSWAVFQRGASTWNIKEKDGNYQIVGYRTHRKGYWEEDSDHKIEFPSGSTVDDVIVRMISILQDAASG